MKKSGSLFSRWLSAISPNCREAIRLQSEAMEHPLPFPRSFGLKVHLLLCKWCRRYRNQISFLRTAAHESSDKDVCGSHHSLSPEAKDRIRQKLAAQRDLPDPPSP